jgi:hypothetical protein
MNTITKLFVLAFGITFYSSCTTDSKQPHATEPKEITDAVINAYKCISFKEGEHIIFSDIKKYFIPQAQLIDFRKNHMNVNSIDQFIEKYKNYIESDQVRLFYEEEITGSTEQFGNIAHRISTYKTYINTMDSIAERGVNSFQLIKTPEGWKVSSIIWDVERTSLKIPDYYL